MSAINIATFDIPNWQLGGASCTLRIFADQTFRNSDGDVILRGSAKGPWYQEIACTISGTTITVPQFTIDSTTDASNRNATYTGILFDSNDVRRDAFFSAYKIPHNFGSTVGWSAIHAYNSSVKSILPYAYPNTNEIAALITSGDAVEAAARIAGDAALDLAKQDVLVSGTNIKAPNGKSILGSGTLKLTDKLLLSDYASLAAAVSGIGATPAVLQLDTNATVSTAVVIPSTLYIEQLKGGTITKSGSGTIEFQGMGLADPTSQTSLFSGFAEGDITWTGSVYPARISSSLWANANWSDRLLNVIAAMNGKQTTIVTYPGAVTAQVRLRSGQSLYLTRGTYTDSLVSNDTPRFVLESNTRVYGDGMGQTIFTENSASRQGRIFASDAMTTGGLDGYNENIEIADMMIVGDPATVFVDSGASTIILGNCHNAHVKRVYIKDVQAYGVYLGGFPTAGYYAKNCSVTHCVFDNVHGQNVGSINGENILVAHNQFINIQPNAGASFIAIVDFEPNVTDDRINNIQVVDNLFDGRGAQQNWNAILLQPGGSFDDLNKGIVSNNIIIGAGFLSNGISLVRGVGYTIEGNYIENTGQSGIVVSNSDFVTISNNFLRYTGSGGIPSVGVNATSNSYIHSNVVENLNESNGVTYNLHFVETETLSYTVDTNGTAVTASAAAFSPLWRYKNVTINGVVYQISAVTDSTHATLASTAGVQSGVTMTTNFSNNLYANNTGNYVLVGTSRVMSAMDRVVRPSRNSAQITANVNDYTPSGGRSVYRYDLTSDASRNITGLTWNSFPIYQIPIDGEEHLLYNAGSQNIVLKHQDAASAAENRFNCNTGADITLGPGQSAKLEYISSRWAVSRRVDASLAPLVSPAFTTPDLGTPSAGTLTNCDGLPASGIVGLTATSAEISQLNDVSVYQETISAAGALSATKVVSKLAVVSGGAVTLAVPDASMYGQLKTIEMTTDDGDVTLALTNVVGQSSGTTATFDAVGDALVLMAAFDKWIVVKEHGITLT